MRYAIGLLLFCGMVAPVYAAPDRLTSSLEKIDPTTRLEQVCDIEAMRRISREAKAFRPDRTVGEAGVASRISGDTLQAPSAAFRSRGQWYRLSFTCRATRDRMKVLSFSYQVGAAIPKEDWEALGLWR